MESELRSNLIACASAFAEARALSLTTVGRLAAGDWRFFDRIGSASFTARKYDDVIGWFWDNWPEDVRWPREVPRPSVEVRT